MRQERSRGFFSHPAFRAAMAMLSGASTTATTSSASAGYPPGAPWSPVEAKFANGRMQRQGAAAPAAGTKSNYADGGGLR